MKTAVKCIAALFLICSVIAILLAFTNSFTLNIIKENEWKATEAALKEVMPNGKFEKIDLASSPLKDRSQFIECYKEEKGGYVFKIEKTGYKDGLVILCGITEAGTVSGAKCLQSNETNGVEKTYGEKFVGLSSVGEKPAIVSGSTKTSKAYREAVSDALEAFKLLSEGGDAQ